MDLRLPGKSNVLPHHTYLVSVAVHLPVSSKPCTCFGVSDSSGLRTPGRLSLGVVYGGGESDEMTLF